MRIINFDDGFTSATAPTVDQTASSVEVTPTGNMVSTNVQSALVEHQIDIDDLNADLAAHAADTANPHVVTKTQVGLGNVDNVQQVPLSQKGVASGVAELDSGGKVPTSQLPDAVVGSVKYLGTWDATANTPTLSNGSGAKGDYYVVSFAGFTAIDGISDWGVGDWIVSNGSQWQKIDNTEAVVSVAGQQGIVTLELDDMTDIDLSTPPNEGQALIYQAGAWKPGQGGGGSGSGKNYISNPSPQFNTDDWSVSGSGTLSRDTSSNIPRESTTGSAFKFISASDEAYVYTNFTLDDTDLNKVIALWNSYYSTVANFRWEIWKNSASDYSGTWTEISLRSDDSSGDSYLPAQTATVDTSFSTDTTLYLQYRLVHNGTNSDTIYFSDVIVSPDKVAVPGAVVENLGYYTVAVSNGGTVAPATAGVEVFRSGSWGYFQFDWGSITTIGSGAGILTFALPTGMTVDPVRMRGPNNTRVGTLSTGIMNDNGTGRRLLNASWAGSSNGVILRYESTSTLISEITGADIAVSDFATFSIWLPIAEWAGAGANFTNNTPEYASVAGTWDLASSTTVFGRGGSLMGGALTASCIKTITWQRPAKFVQCWASKDGMSWAPILGSQIGPSNSTVVPSLTAAGSTGSGAGVAWRSSGNQTFVEFSRYLNMANDDAPTVDWPSSQAYWMCTNSDSILPVGFAEATQTSLGLVKRSYEELDPSSSGSFSAAQPVWRIEKIGEMVVLTTSDTAHPSSATPATASGFIPVQYRPVAAISAVYIMTGSAVRQVSVSTDGTVTFNYRDWAGTAAASTSTVVATLSWVIDR